MPSRQMQSRQRRSKRDRLRERDGDNCWYCDLPLVFVVLGKNPSKWYATLEHLHNSADGGSNRLDNLVLAHKGCNSSASTLRTLEEKLERRAILTERWRGHIAAGRYPQWMLSLKMTPKQQQKSLTEIIPDR